ncbi:EAL domain-containing protein [Oceanisphaera sp. IT1-181]|uniref:EAL domain-containing protein n=1 Tax=Oceanisphaera sp. IT1-181 TaxID=3081199 RepID=UPI0029CA0393|nr:EAL domain-containing protein [Oceanisphaera sp. IT1-181]
MRERAPFGQALLLSGFIMLLLSILVPWWASYSALQQQAQIISSQLTATSSSDSATAALAGLVNTTSDQPLTDPAPAWWFGQLGANQQYSQGETLLFYRLDTKAANQQWVWVTLPLLVANLLIFITLYRRWRQIYNVEHAHLQNMLLDPEANNFRHEHPIANAIVNLHQNYDQQLSIFKRELHAAQQQSFQDSLTLLGNRFAFRRDLALLLNDDNHLASSTLMIVRASSLQSINIEQGFQAGDQYLQDIVKIVRKVIQPEIGAHGYRISGTDIAVLFKGQCEPLAHRLGDRLQQELYHYQHIHELTCAAYIGFTQLLPGQSAEHVLTRADLALAQAQGEEPNSWSMLLKQDEDESMGESQWRQRLQSMLDDNQVLLQVQPAQIYKSEMQGYNEIYTRFPNTSGGTYPASTVFAMLQRLNMSMQFEQKIIEVILTQIKQSPLTGQRWAINLTPASLQQSSFLIWLERILLRERDITSKLVFELDEQVLQHQLEVNKRLLEVIRRAGARYAVSRFGHGYGSFRLLQEIKPDYVKLDGLLVKLLHQDHTTQQFVRMIIDLAQRLGCRVIAEGVETMEQKQLLESMHIDGVQGYLIAKPSDFTHFKALS